MPSSKIKVAIAKIMKEEGYITSFEVVDGKIACPKSVAHSAEICR